MISITLARLKRGEAVFRLWRDESGNVREWRDLAVERTTLISIFT